MWLIEYDTGKFANAERTVRFDISSNGGVLFWLDDDYGGYRVAPEFTELFLNNLQALNNNIVNVQTRYRELNGVGMKVTSPQNNKTRPLDDRCF